MCLILVAWQAHPHFPLVVAANRDEFFNRATAAAGFWPEQTELLAGRDLTGGGTWMGVTRGGRFAALTNFRDPANQRDDAPSRGGLVSDFLRGAETPARYLDRIAPQGSTYNGFNLLLREGDTLTWYSNVSGERRTLAPGIYGVSNELLDSPWPKVMAAKSDLARALAALPADDALLHLLRDDRTYPDEQLPRTGVSLELERMLSAAFVRLPGYGTRSSTVLVESRDGQVRYDEQTWDAQGLPGERHRFVFSRTGANA